MLTNCCSAFRYAKKICRAASTLVRENTIREIAGLAARPCDKPVVVVRKLRMYLTELMSQICTYCCNNICNKPLDCEKHYCQESGGMRTLLFDARKNHDLRSNAVDGEERESCVDPVPICDKICFKRLRCGQPSNRLKNIAHFASCHCTDVVSMCTFVRFISSINLRSLKVHTN